jgi:hypothetical protein
LSKRSKRFAAVPVVELLDGKEDYEASGGFGTISKATHNGQLVAVKAIKLYSAQDNSKAEKVGFA